MPLKSDEIILPGDIKEIFVYDSREPKKKDLAYRIDKKKKKIIFFPNRDIFVTKNIIIEGFSSLPNDFSLLGYIKSGATYYLNKVLSEKNVSKVTIKRKGKNTFRKYKDGYHVTLDYSSFSYLNTKLSSIKRESSYERSQFASEFFHETFPRRYKKPIITHQRQIARVVGNLDQKIIPHLEVNDVNIIIDFFEGILKSKYKSEVYRRKLFSIAKMKVDDIALDNIISELNKMIKRNDLENKWCEFLKKYLFLLDSRYVESIPKLNLVLAGSREVDFGLIDSQEYLDIFEVKRPGTRLLSNKTDRGNYYWHGDAIKAIVQAEKYYYNAEGKKDALTHDIKREIHREVKVTRPRVIILMGSTTQLDNDNKKEDFRVLRMSLKNVEVVPYDELLERLMNQKNRVFVY